MVHPDAIEILERIEDNRYWYNAQVPKHEQERKPGEHSSSGREKRVSWQGTRKEAIDQSEPETSGESMISTQRRRKGLTCVYRQKISGLCQAWENTPLNCQAENICNDFPTREIMQSVRSTMRDVVSDKRQSRQTLSSVGKYAGCVKRGK